MVVFSELTSFGYPEKDRCNEYWKLDSYHSYDIDGLISQLKYAGIKIRKPTTKDSMVQACSQLDRGMLVYHRFSPTELKTLCRQRNMQVQRLGLKKKGEVIEILERADKEAHFRFKDLPPELRVEIYRFYFQSLPRLTAPTQPPVSRSCRLMRQESLSLFYQTCALDLDLGRYDFAKVSVRFFDYISESQFKSIQHLRIKSCGVPYTESFIWDAGKVSCVYKTGQRVEEPSERSHGLSKILEEITKDGLTKSGLLQFMEAVQERRVVR